jgi:hypothetical protein
MSGTQDGIAIGGVNDFVISGNTIGDNQLTPTMQWAINVTSGVSGRYTIVGNECGPCTNSSVIHDGGTGTAKVVANNGGVPPFDFIHLPANGISYNLGHAIAFQWDGTNVRTYVDGTIQGTIPNP